MLDGGGDAGGAGVAEAKSVGWSGAQAEEGGVEKTLLGTEREVGEALAEGDGEEGEEDAVDDDVPAVGLTGFDGFEITLERAASKGAQAAELGAAQVTAGVGERGCSERLKELAIQVDQFTELTAHEVLVGVADSGQFDGYEQSVAVAGEETVNGGEGIRFGGLDEFGQSGEGGERFRGTESLGERMDIAGELITRRRCGRTAGR